MFSVSVCQNKESEYNDPFSSSIIYYYFITSSLSLFGSREANENNYSMVISGRYNAFLFNKQKIHRHQKKKKKKSVSHST